jgi:tRNA pseudouridine55 synthase
MYSALKHKGVPLYTLARRGEKVERRAREVETYGLSLISCELPVFRIETSCSRGMYVRVLAEEIGSSLGVPAHLKSLVRTRIGQFDLESAVPDSDFGRLAEMESPGIGMAEALGHLRPVELDRQQAAGVRRGIAPRAGTPFPRVGEIVRLIDDGGGLCAIAEAAPAGMLRLRRVFGGEEKG